MLEAISGVILENTFLPHLQLLLEIVTYVLSAPRHEFLIKKAPIAYSIRQSSAYS
ncbi:hypothetical protein [Gracilibacillus boraciitolerans]|uniref:hypothetical protein n=1 Tax=Gracilibacillus boraciitolerans TaxID=307521 RepID=UPI001F48C985|nr:hypothetical protein [Gracilibacillus boraciitolerans]